MDLSKVAEVGEVGDVVGESPRWDDRSAELIWVDAERPILHTYSPATGRTTTSVTDHVVTSVALGPDGDLFGTAHDGIRRLHRTPTTGLEVGELIQGWRAPVGCAVNDSAVDPVGRLLVGFGSEETPGLGEVRTLSLITGAAGVIKTGMFLPNGIAWSPTGDRMYLADSFDRVVYAIEYDAATGRTGRAEEFLRSQDGEVPDGLTVDAAGDVWVAFWGGGHVSQFRPDGRLERRLDLPVSQVASCVFGGPDLADLYVTTASYGVDEDGAGSLFVAHGIGRGLPSGIFQLASAQGEQ
ncbi:MAG: SMP-30/gluconolactonase/LRE family protein [Agromyces sp.]